MAAKLVVPYEKYLYSYLDACRDFKKHNITSFGDNPDTFDTWKHTIFQRLANNRLGIDLPSGYVPASTFWLVENDEFIGIGSIRHRLTESLERFGGHIGYAIRCDKWGMGYGTVQLNLLLKEAAILGIKRTLITCDESNIASARVIEKNGGVYQDTIDNIIDDKPRRTKRYWASTSNKLAL